MMGAEERTFALRRKIGERAESLVGRAMMALYIVAIVVLIRPKLSAPAAWLLGGVAGAVILRLTVRDVAELIRLVIELIREGRRAKKGLVHAISGGGGEEEQNER